MRPIRLVSLICVALLIASRAFAVAADTGHACTGSTAFGATTATCALTGLSAGNAIVGGVYFNDATGTLSSMDFTATCTGGSPTLKNNSVSDGGNAKGALFYFYNFGVGGSCTVRANFSEAMDEAKVWAREVSGLGTTDPFDVSGGSTDIFRNTTCTDCVTTSTITPSVSGDYLFGLTIAGGSPALSPGTGWTDGATDDAHGTAEFRVYNSTTTIGAAFSRTDTTGTTDVVFTIALKAAGAATVTPRGPLLGVYP